MLLTPSRSTLQGTFLVICIKNGFATLRSIWYFMSNSMAVHMNIPSKISIETSVDIWVCIASELVQKGIPSSQFISDTLTVMRYWRVFVEISESLRIMWIRTPFLCIFCVLMMTLRCMNWETNFRKQIIINHNQNNKQFFAVYSNNVQIIVMRSEYNSNAIEFHKNMTWKTRNLVTQMFFFSDILLHFRFKCSA